MFALIAPVVFLALFAFGRYEGWLDTFTKLFLLFMGIWGGVSYLIETGYMSRL